MFTTVAYSANQDTGGVLTYVPALADQHVRVEGNNIVVPEGMDSLLAAIAIGANINRAQVEAPSLRRTLLLDVFPLNTGALPVSPACWHEGFYNPIPLDAFEPIRALTSETVAGAERGTVILWLGDGPQSEVSGEIYTVRCTSNTTLVAGAWTNGALTITQTLPAGRYQVVGMSAFSANLLAARLVFVGGTWRPGCIGSVGLGHLPSPLFRRGRLGVWGEFAHDQPPTVDFLATAADTSQVIHLDVIKVA